MVHFKNDFLKRLNGLSVDECRKELKDVSKGLMKARFEVGLGQNPYPCASPHKDGFCVKRLKWQRIQLLVRLKSFGISE